MRSCSFCKKEIDACICNELTDAEIDAALEASDWPKLMLSPFILEKMRVFARAIEKAAYAAGQRDEREACIAICDHAQKEMPLPQQRYGAGHVGTTIRARSNGNG